MLARPLPWVVAGLAGGLALGYSVYRRDMQRAYARLPGKSSLVQTAYGQVEFAAGGTGVPVLVSHGSGGGFDQGQLIAETFLDQRFHWIAPSRFGYLRSTFNAGASFDEQAHAYAALLEQLGLEKAAVVAVSHGGPSALLFALLYPERVTSLTLVSAGVTAVATANQGKANQKGNALTTIFKYDWLYWAITRLLTKQFMELMGASEAVIARLSSEQRDLVERIITEMNPASLRAAGVAFDHRAKLPGKRIAPIQAPTLIVHASDDSLQLYQNAAFAADAIVNSRLLRFEQGGHLLMAVEQPVIRAAVQRHILDHAGA